MAAMATRFIVARNPSNAALSSWCALGAEASDYIFTRSPKVSMRYLSKPCSAKACSCACTSEAAEIGTVVFSYLLDLQMRRPLAVYVAPKSAMGLC